MIHTLLILFCILAICAVIYWGISQLPLPPVVKTVAIVIMALFLLVYIYQILLGGGTVSLR